MWYVYFLRLNNGDVYVGSTDDLRRRLASHERGNVISTRGNRPIVLAAYIAVENENAARKLERYFKSGSGKAFAKKRFLLTAEKRCAGEWVSCRQVNPLRQATRSAYPQQT